MTVILLFSLPVDCTIIKKSKGYKGTSSSKKVRRKKSDSSRNEERQYFQTVPNNNKGNTSAQFVFSDRGLIQVKSSSRDTYKHRKRMFHSRIRVPLSFGNTVIRPPLHLSSLSEPSTQTLLSHHSHLHHSPVTSNDSMLYTNNNNKENIAPSRSIPDRTVTSAHSSSFSTMTTANNDVFKDAPALVYEEFQELMHDDDYDLLGIPLPSISDISSIESFDTDDDVDLCATTNNTNRIHHTTSNHQVMHGNSIKQEDMLLRHCHESFDTGFPLFPLEFQNLQMSF